MFNFFIFIQMYRQFYSILTKNYHQGKDLASFTVLNSKNKQTQKI